eukprot:Polyplicarium_translucidae@DN2466_c0_g1_i3.p1
MFLATYRSFTEPQRYLLKNLRIVRVGLKRYRICPKCRHGVRSHPRKLPCHAAMLENEGVYTMLMILWMNQDEDGDGDDETQFTFFEDQAEKVLSSHLSEYAVDKVRAIVLNDLNPPKRPNDDSSQPGDRLSKQSGEIESTTSLSDAENREIVRQGKQKRNDTTSLSDAENREIVRQGKQKRNDGTRIVPDFVTRALRRSMLDVIVTTKPFMGGWRHNVHHAAAASDPQKKTADLTQERSPRAKTAKDCSRRSTRKSGTFAAGEETSPTTASDGPPAPAKRRKRQRAKKPRASKPVWRPVPAQ